MNAEVVSEPEEVTSETELRNEIDNLFDELKEYDYEPGMEKAKEIVLEAQNLYGTVHTENEVNAAREKLESMLERSDETWENDQLMDEKITTLINRLFQYEEWYRKNFHAYSDKETT